MAHWKAHAALLGLTGKVDHHRHAHRFLVHDSLSQELMATHHVAMVGCEDNYRVVPLPGFAQRSENAPKMRIDQTAQAPIIGDHTSPVAWSSKRKPALADLAEVAVD